VDVEQERGIARRRGGRGRRGGGERRRGECCCDYEAVFLDKRTHTDSSTTPGTHTETINK